jgi:hypothetical protein
MNEEFNKWWDEDDLTTEGNNFVDGTPAYWAWEGWCAAVKAEREACAKVCDDFERAKWESVKNITQNGGRLAFAGPMHCAAAIRARSST